jgi:hypothetical protein
MSNAKDAKNKPVEITLGEKVYKIRFTLNSFIELEDIYESIDKAMEALQGDVVINKETGKPEMIPNPDEKSDIKEIEKRNPNFKALRNMLWAGMIPDNPTITSAEVGNLLTFANMQYVMTKVNVALINSMPEKVGEDELKN